ncbi:hypothetical protein AB0878_01330 [Amycolatopsis sp. NPDC047767]|uniref:hypothetical protein n=1 Tax=Amycolatopsis sp. NPDC047767 TaxID=3156765 RepID=UPI0034573519
MSAWPRSSGTPGEARAKAKRASQHGEGVTPERFTPPATGDYRTEVSSVDINARGLAHRLETSRGLDARVSAAGA